MIALTWPTDSAVPHQSNHDTAYLLQSPSNSPPNVFLHQWYCILLAAQFSYLFLLVLPVRSLSHRPPELPANLPASSFTIPACPCDPSAIDHQSFQPTCLLLPSPFLPAGSQSSLNCLPPLRTSIFSKPA
ncbi:hypothetical protein F7725_005155 [Dissostichus mawsoni]|uniref:Uncharacterized protein n=1 Tax=Dissostichus mawsoni TaxID=36200 RepID=A0A7J5YQW8_DISMA|nr:hypothetical protein F7725_005155 [Dissostichus mawsoni]